MKHAVAFVPIVVALGCTSTRSADTTAALQLELQATLAREAALRAECEQLERELAAALEDLQVMVAPAPAPVPEPPTIKINLVAHVVRVRARGAETHIEIDAGSRDGVEVGWTVPIEDAEGRKGSVTITMVDINRSVGIATFSRPITAGDRVLFRPEPEGG